MFPLGDVLNYNNTSITTPSSTTLQDQIDKLEDLTRLLQSQTEMAQSEVIVMVIIQRFSRLASRIHHNVSSIPTRSSAEDVFNCRRFDYSVVVFFRAWQYSTKTQLKY